MDILFDTVFILDSAEGIIGGSLFSIEFENAVYLALPEGITSFEFVSVS